MTLDEDTLNYICELLNICPCVDDNIIQLLSSELTKCSNQASFYDGSIQSQLVRIHLEQNGLIEHGTSIRGSWLTSLGEEILYKLVALEEQE